MSNLIMINPGEHQITSFGELCVLLLDGRYVVARYPSTKSCLSVGDRRALHAINWRVKIEDWGNGRWVHFDDPSIKWIAGPERVSIKRTGGWSFDAVTDDAEGE